MLDDDVNASDSLAHSEDQCLRGKADRWCTSELSKTVGVDLHTDVDSWYQELEGTFTEVPGRPCLTHRYTFADLRVRTDHEEDNQQTIVNGKNAGTLPTELARVMTAYNHLMLLRGLLPQQPTEQSTVWEFLRQITLVKRNWIDTYKSYNSPPREPLTSGKSKARIQNLF